MSTMLTATDAPRVWVGCLACYNAGQLVGEWFDALDAPTEMDEWSPRVFGNRGPFSGAPEGHAEEMHEELWVFDRTNFHGLLSRECSPVEAQRIAQLIDSWGADVVASFAAFVTNGGYTVDADAVEAYDEAFCGVWDSEKHYAYELADELGFEAGDAWPARHVDWDAATRDLFMSDYFSVPTSDLRVWVFRAL